MHSKNSTKKQIMKKIVTFIVDRILIPRSKPLAAETENVITIIIAIIPIKSGVTSVPAIFDMPPPRINIPAPRLADIPATKANKQMILSRLPHHPEFGFFIIGKSIEPRENSSFLL